MKLTADIIEKAKKITGGKNLTKKRMEAILDDYARLKAAKPGEAVLLSPGVTPKDISDQESFQRAAGYYGGTVELSPPVVEPFEIPLHEPCTAVLSSPGGSGRPDLHCGFHLGHKGEHGYVENVELGAESREFPLTVPPELVAKAADPAPGLDPTTNAIIAELRALRQEMSALRQPATPQDKAEAIMGGKLPVTGGHHGPVGFTGQAALPRGQWFKSPFGPPIEMQICGCEQCKPHKLYHYFCVICRSGPHEFTRYVGGVKTHLAPGGAWGVSHVTCSPACWNNYLPLVDGRRRMQTGVPRAPQAPPMPEFAGTTAGENAVQLPEARPLGSD